MGNKKEKAHSAEYIVWFLQQFGLHPLQADGKLWGVSGFNRNIFFSIGGMTYRIEWYVNESHLYFGEGRRKARYPFRYVFFDDCYPVEGGNISIGFSYRGKERQVLAGNMRYPYDMLRVPLPETLKRYSESTVNPDYYGKMVLKTGDKCVKTDNKAGKVVLGE